MNLDTDTVLSSDESESFSHGIVITEDLTIDGQGHLISATDGQERTGIFSVFGNASLTLKNLILKDASASIGSAIFLNTSGTLTLENVTFINNHAEFGGAIAIFSGNLIQNNTKYINNSADNYGGAVYIAEGTIFEDRSYYENNHAEIGGTTYMINGALESHNSVYINNSASANGGGLYLNQGVCYLNNLQAVCNYASLGGFVRSAGNLIVNNSKFIKNSVENFGVLLIPGGWALVNNTQFIGSYSEGAVGDIYITDANATIANSNFTGSNATQTAGAIGFKSGSALTVEDCIFNATTAGKDGGAIFVDKGDLIVSDSQFINCQAAVGGAITLISGTANITGSRFENNIAYYTGGALHIGFSEGEIADCIFTGNAANEGGALYLDYTLGMNITDSQFRENYANSYGGAVLSYDGTNCLSNCYFSQNTALNGSGILSIHDRELILDNNNFTDDSLVLNKTQIFYLISGEASEIDLVNNSITLINLPSRYDLRDFGWITSVKDQGSMGACWAFGSLAALESSILKATNITYDFSENNMKDIMLRYSKWGCLVLGESGTDFMTVAYLVSWMGPDDTSDSTYDQLGKITGPYGTTLVHVQDVAFIDTREDSLDNDEIKWAIINYGAVETGFYYDPSCISADSKSYYYGGEPDFNHIVCIVGWDDNYPKENFATAPPGDGAFIIKNSWGNETGDGGYIYISYYDTTLATIVHSNVYIINNTVSYNKNYQYDFTGLSGYIDGYDADIYYRNSFTSYGNDLIAAVGSYFDDDINDYELWIYVNGEVKHSQNGTVDHEGYATIKLNEYIPVKEGDRFTAVVKTSKAPYMVSLSKSETGTVSRLALDYNNSFISYDGSSWTDLKTLNATACLKVYTVAGSILSEDLTKYYRNASQFNAGIYNKDGTPLANTTAGLMVNGVLYNRTTDENGTVRLNINLNPGEYDITVFNYETGENRTSKITVLSRLAVDDLVKYYRNASQYEIEVLDSHGNPLANKTVRININGVMYERTSNENGTAVLNINLNPGEYIATVTDEETGQEVSSKVTVLSTILGCDLTKTYGTADSYNVTVLDSHGNPAANQKVTLNINGVIYERISDENGTARLNINLIPGEYIITSKYNGLYFSNTITVEEAI